MARSIAQIHSSLVKAVKSTPQFANLSDSQASVWNVWLYDVAVAMHGQEELQYIFKQEVTDTVNQAVPNTVAWYKKKVDVFQFGSVVQLVSGSPQYPTITPEQRIITRSSVKDTAERITKIKVAKGTSTLQPLATEEISALKSYLDKIQHAGAKLDVISLQPDRMRIQCEVYFDGQYVESTVKQEVKKAMETYFATLPFNGIVKRSGISEAVENVPGVQDVRIVKLQARDEQTAFTTALPDISLQYETAAGYVIPEDAQGNGLEDTITMFLA